MVNVFTVFADYLCKMDVSSLFGGTLCLLLHEYPASSFDFVKGNERKNRKRSELLEAFKKCHCSSCQLCIPELFSLAVLLDLSVNGRVKSAMNAVKMVGMDFDSLE